MSDQNSVKITAEDRAVFEAHGKPQGSGRNLTDGARVIVAAWREAGMPALPADPCAGRGTCELASVVRRWGDTWRWFVIAGAGKGASSGARRLAEWARQVNNC